MWRWRRPHYYGWRIVWTLALTETVSWGILFYAFTVFLAPMQAELGWSTPAITGAYSLALLVSMLLAPPLGRWLDRAGPRVPMTIGSILGTLLLLAWSQVRNEAIFYLIFAGMGVALALTLYEPAFAATSAWFVRGRSRAMLLLTTIGGFASTIFIPLAGWLTDQLGWRGALVALAVILGVTTIPAHWLVLRRRPQDMGLLPDNAPPVVGAPLPPPAGVTVAQARRDPAYWWLCLAFFLGTAASVAIGLYLIPVLLERGDSMAQATLLLGLLGPTQAVGRLLVTALDRRLPEPVTTTLLFGLHALGMAIVLVPAGLAAMVLAMACFGVGRGAITIMRATLVANRYGIANFAAISGIPAAAQMAARASAPIGGGLLVSALGSYQAMLAVILAMGIGSTVAIGVFAWLARPLALGGDAPAGA
ncbi:MAG: MFS transporter [Thermomicrobiales bacterium]